LDQNSYRNLIAGTDNTLARRLLRGLLRIISVVYCIAMVLRNFLYHTRLLKSHKVDAVVISIGNITTGGTGKTPLVIWLYELLNKNQDRYAVLTRGYKGRHGKLADEPAMLAKSCPQAKIIINPDRIAGASKAITQFGSEILIMDDGFQHRRLARDLDIVAIDATCPFGYGWLLPAGLLREPVGAMRRADAVVITRCNQVSDQQIEQIEEKIRAVRNDIPIARAVYRYPHACLAKGRTLSIEQLREKTIFSFCGIANPNAFANDMTKLGLNVVGLKIYNDHHDYTRQDISDIYKEAKCLSANLILSTHKDWVKTALELKKNEDILFAYLPVRLEFIAEGDKIEALVNETVGKLSCTRKY